MPRVFTLNYRQHVISRFSTWDYWVYWTPCLVSSKKVHCKTTWKHQLCCSITSTELYLYVVSYYKCVSNVLWLFLCLNWNVLQNNRCNWKNNGRKIWEVQNKIIGKIIGKDWRIIASGLAVLLTHFLTLHNPGNLKLILHANLGSLQENFTVTRLTNISNIAVTSLLILSYFLYIIVHYTYGLVYNKKLVQLLYGFNYLHLGTMTWATAVQYYV